MNQALRVTKAHLLRTGGVGSSFRTAHSFSVLQFIFGKAAEGVPHAIWYESPNWSGVSLNVMYAPGQNRDDTSSIVPSAEPGPHCYAGGQLQGISTGINYKF